MLLYKKWQTAGISKVKNIIVRGKWVDPLLLNSRVGMQQMLFDFEFTKIKKANFPPQWMNILRNVNTQINTSEECTLIELASGDLINVSTTTSKQYYSLLVNEKQFMPSVIYYWEDVLRLGCELDWKAVLQFKFGKSFDHRIKQFNFKLFHKIVPSKSNLYRWQISTDNMCNICKEKETTMHILLICKESRLFWKTVTSLIYNIYGLEFNMSEKIIIIGYDIKNDKNNIVNIMLTLAQYVVYKIYLRRNYENVKVYARKLFIEFKSIMKTYFRSKINQKNLDMTKIEKILLAL